MKPRKTICCEGRGADLSGCIVNPRDSSKCNLAEVFSKQLAYELQKNVINVGHSNVSCQV